MDQITNPVKIPHSVKCSNEATANRRYPNVLVHNVFFVAKSLIDCHCFGKYFDLLYKIKQANPVNIIAIYSVYTRFKTTQR